MRAVLFGLIAAMVGRSTLVMAMSFAPTSDQCEPVADVECIGEDLVDAKKVERSMKRQTGHARCGPVPCCCDAANTRVTFECEHSVARRESSFRALK